MARFRHEVRAFAEAEIAPHAAETDRTEAYPWHLIEKMRDFGLFGMTIPKSLGGQGRSYLEAALAIEEIARACATCGRICVETNMGAISAVMEYGTPAQKTLAASLVLAGDKPAICITEPEAGSAATEMTTRADKRGERYVLNGTKHWITGGGVSKLHLIFARVFDEAGEEQGIGGFIAVLGESDGLVIGQRQHAMGVRGLPETLVHFNDLEVPDSHVLAPPGGFARGFGQLMNAYNSQRVGAGTVALGVAAAANAAALAYAQEREQFGRPICEFQGLQWMLADMDMEVEVARTMLWHAAATAVPGSDRPFPDPVAAARAKVIASEMAVRVTNMALQIHGAKGYGRDCAMERHVRDARMFTIAGGTAQILRTLIASRLLRRKLPQRRAAPLRQVAQ
ncbi:MAG: acyl-CoA dehydrogenase family protein [Pararhodobacter sp.]|nr:acyl-CoA dehydrogenase family protein [Pararhodobacter sp.]